MSRYGGYVETDYNKIEYKYNKEEAVAICLEIFGQDIWECIPKDKKEDDIENIRVKLHQKWEDWRNENKNENENENENENKNEINV